jgi:alpha-tubulin suppressor-like RCC1 family protein
VANSWASSGGGTNNDSGRALAASGSDLFVVGETGATAAKFGSSQAGVAPPQAAVVGRLSASTGTWQRADTPLQGGTATSSTEATTTDAAGNVYVTGSFTGQIGFGGFVLYSAGNNDIFVAKWEAGTSSWAWAVRAGGTGHDYGRSIAVSNGNIYIAGNFLSGANTYVGSTALPGAGGVDIFLAKYVDNGTSATDVWAIGDGSTTNGEVAYGVAVNGANVYVAGTFNSYSNTRFAGTILNGTGGQEMFLAKYVDNGSSVTNGWAVSGGGPNSDLGQGVAVNGSNVYVTGDFHGISTIAGTALTGSGSDVYVAKYIDNGSTVANGWAVSGGGAGLDESHAIAVSGANVYITGSFGCASNAVFAGTPLVGQGASSAFGDNDLFVAKYVDNGATVANGWAVEDGGSDYECGNGIAVGGNSVYIVGRFSTSTVTIAGSPLLNSGAADLFVARYTDNGSSASPGAAARGGGALGSEGNAIAVSGGNIYVVGQIRPSAYFDSIVLSHPANGNATNFFGQWTGMASYNPIISNLSPDSGTAGSVITLNGFNLTGATGITFMGTNGPIMVTGFGVNANGTQITGIVVPAGAMTGPLTVTTPVNTSLGTAFIVAPIPAPTTTAAGQYHSVSIRPDGTLWAWGSNSSGQLGDGTTGTDRISPVQIGSAADWQSVAAGSLHTLAVRADGTLWAWGVNNYGQLGDGTTTDQAMPVQIGTATNWRSVAAGSLHSVAVRTDGTLWTWGRNGNGQLGDGTTTDHLSPAQVGTATTWLTVAGGEFHTAAVSTNGTLWTWGSNGNGQLGNGTTIQRNSPSQVGSVATWTSVTAGQFHTLALRADNTLWAWGYNNAGQLGDGSSAQRINPVQVGATVDWLTVAAGQSHTVAVSTAGTLWTWGLNTYGQLGSGNTTARAIPGQVGTATSWLRAVAGYTHSLSDQGCRTLWTWGRNGNGQLGDGTTTQRTSPVRVYNAIGQLSFTPSSAPIGSIVAVTGIGLAGITALNVNGALVPLANVSANTATGFSFIVPAGAVASGTVSITTGCGTATSTALTVTSSPGVPIVSTFSPAAGPINTVVTISGASLTGTTAVTFNGVAASSFTVNSATSLTVTVPPGTTTGTVQVTTPGGTATTMGVFTMLSVYNSIANQCLTTTLVASTGTGQWQYLLAANGQLVAAVNDQGNALGNVSVDFIQAVQPTLRTDSRGRNYLDRNWKLTAQNGFAGQRVLVRFYALNSEFARLRSASSDVTSLNQLRLTQYAGPNEDCNLDNNGTPTDLRLLMPTAASSPSGTDWFAVESEVADHFSEFYLSGGSAPLPVELVRFTAERQGTASLLRWSTASEKDNASFEVEASVDGQHYLRVGTVAGAGTSTILHDYQFTDERLNRYGASQVYYRLRQVDHNGTAMLSVVRVVTTVPLTKLTAYPNPAGHQVQIGGAVSQATVEVYDATGRLLFHTIADIAGTATLTLPSGLPAGIYLVRTGEQALRLTVE